MGECWLLMGFGGESLFVVFWCGGGGRCGGRREGSGVGKLAREERGKVNC